MTKKAHELFENVFENNECFKDVSNIDMLRTAGECDRLKEYIFEKMPDATLEQCMHFAYWWGVLSVYKRPITNQEVLTLISGWEWETPTDNILVKEGYLP